MPDPNFIGIIRTKGRDLMVARVRWAPSGSANQTLTEAEGVVSVTRTGAGLYTILLTDTKCQSIECHIQPIVNDTTLFHFVRVESINNTAGTIAVSHKSVAYASIASGPTPSDTVDQLEALILYRTVV